MTWQVDPFLLSFLDSLELELASALEIQHRRGDDVPIGRPISRLRENERIVTRPWLPIVWPFKFVMPVAATLLLLQGVAEFVRCWMRAIESDAAGPTGPAAAGGVEVST